MTAATTRRKSLVPAMLEDELQAQVMQICSLRGLLVHHCRAARLQSGRWATPIQGAAGFPDLVIAGRRGVLYRELKTATGRVSPGQANWHNRLLVAGADIGVWRPVDLRSGRINDELGAIQ